MQLLVLVVLLGLAAIAVMLAETQTRARTAQLVVRIAGVLQPSRREEFVGELDALQWSERVPGFEYAVGALAGAVVERADSLRSPLVISMVSKSFGTTQALHNVNLEIHPGSITALMGANGAGKSTLLRLLAGQESLEHGKITFGDVDIDTSRGAPEGISVIRHDDPLVDHFSVAENIVFGHRRGWLLNRNEERKQALNAMSAIGASIDPAKTAGELSQSERLQVLLAREVHLERAQLIVLDEPTSGMSERSAAEIFDSIRLLQSRGQLGVLFVSHRIDQVFRVADRIAVLYNGMLVHDSATSSTRPKHILAKVTDEGRA